MSTRATPPEEREHVEAVLNAVRPIGKEGRQDDDRNGRPNAKGRQIDQCDFGQQWKQYERHESIARKGNEKCQDSDPAPRAHFRHHAAGTDQGFECHHHEEHDRQGNGDQ